MRRLSGPPASALRPMLAVLTDAPFNDPDWIFEKKWDGYRIILETHKAGGPRLLSRNGADITHRYPALVKAASAIKRDAVLDGELVALIDGKPNFQELQNARRRDVDLAYCAFDLLFLDGVDIRKLPLIERRKKLKSLVPSNSIIQFSDDVKGNGTAFFEKVKAKGLEGIVAKRADSFYLSGERSDEWRKIKTRKRQEAVIVGFTEPKGARRYLGSLVLGLYEGDALVFSGRAGTGFSDESLKMLHGKLKALATKKKPWVQRIPDEDETTWVKPEMVCEVEFTEWTTAGEMRHPVFMGLRDDKKARDVMREREVPSASMDSRRKEEPEETRAKERTMNAMHFTNLDKPFWPQEGYTKGDVIDYYREIAPIILPYLKGRPMVLNRHPNGIDDEGFFQKNVDPAHLPEFVKTVSIRAESTGEIVHYAICENESALLYLANLGCIELNPWNSRVASIHRPDYFIVDIDPGDAPFDDVITVAHVVRQVLEEACEESYCKTSGKTGLHVYVPLGARYEYKHVRQFSELVSKMVNHRLPEMTSMEHSPAKRKGKIYLDTQRNAFGQTACAAYCIRPYPKATVSTPLKWNEVKAGLHPSQFTIKTIMSRIEKIGDLWKPVLKKGVDLKKAIASLEEKMN